MSFASRVQAGQVLAERLVKKQYELPVVLALPRGGVPVAFEVARALKAPLDLLLVRKIGVPWQPELAAGAIVDGEKPEIVFNTDVMAAVGIGKAEVEQLSKKELAQIERRRKLYLEGRSPVSVTDRTAIVVDDGIATGTTVKAALQALKRRNPKKVVLAVPVAPIETIEELEEEVDEIICLETPRPFFAIGMFYADFSQVGDEDVIELLRSASDFASEGKKEEAKETVRPQG